MVPATGGVIYGVRLRAAYDYRYIGLTTKTGQQRLRQHFKVAAAGRKTPFYDWLRLQDRDNVLADELQFVEGLNELGEAEIAWIAYLKRDGQLLLNLAEGGLGPTGVVWTGKMREAARVRSTGRKGLSRFADDNPFYGLKHSDEQREKWSVQRRGSITGEAIRTSGSSDLLTPATGASCRRKLALDCRSNEKAREIRTSGGARARRHAARCPTLRGGVQSPRANGMPTPGTTRTKARSRARVSTASTM